MLCYDPEKRITLDQVAEHAYMQGKTATQSQLVRYLSKRLQTTNPQQEQAR